MSAGRKKVVPYSASDWERIQRTDQIGRPGYACEFIYGHALKKGNAYLFATGIRHYRIALQENRKAVNLLVDFLHAVDNDALQKLAYAWELEIWKDLDGGGLKIATSTLGREPDYFHLTGLASHNVAAIVCDYARDNNEA